MYRIKRLLTALAVLCLLTGGVTAADTSTASASATCSGYGCDGRDPYSTGCAGSGASYYVVSSVPLINNQTGVSSWNYGYVQLWWSQTCQTNWTRVVYLAGNIRNGWVGIRRDGSEEMGENFTTNVAITPMFYAPSPIGAWGDAQVWNTSGVEYYNTTARV